MVKKVLLFIYMLFLSFIGLTQSIKLNSNWQFKQVGKSKWYKARVPGTVHTDLLANKLIPDPFFRDNENKVQWIENEAWEYQTNFKVPKALSDKKYIEVVFDGLDTHAEVFLNGVKIIYANNMFRQWHADVKRLLKPGDNILRIKFHSSVKIAWEAKKNETIVHPENERIYVRKAQYQFGWDWGPRLVTSGIWKDVWLRATDEKISFTNTFSKSNFRKVELVREKDTVGESFYFKIDGKPTFIKGANWIPAESFLPRAKKLHLYEPLIKAAKEANINMLRVWGGGAYEDDIFYELCEKYDILVWQDFMFAGTMYPGDKDFLKNVTEEVSYQVKRLRKFKCIVLWCGNNEITEGWHNWGWQKQFSYSAADSAKLWNNYQMLFHKLIPEIVQKLDPHRPYWPSSPSNGWGREIAYKVGDVHYWGVWWGKEPVEKYNEKIGRFNSEFGMQGFPDMKTIAEFSLPEDRILSSSVMKTHQKHPIGYENIELYIKNRFRYPQSFENLVYVSQLMQADAIKTAVHAHRGNKPVTMGTMFWQLNDCWPVTSWSAIDYYGRKKALYYQIKRDFSDLILLPSEEENVYRVKVVSDLDSIINFKIEADYVDFRTGVKNTIKVANKSQIKPNGIISFDLEKAVLGENPLDGCINFKLIHNNYILASNLLFLAKPKDLNLPQANVKYELIGNNSLRLISDHFAYGIYLDTPDGIHLSDNYFHLLPGEEKIVKYRSSVPAESIRQLKIKSLIDTY